MCNFDFVSLFYIAATISTKVGKISTLTRAIRIGDQNELKIRAACARMLSGSFSIKPLLIGSTILNKETGVTTMIDKMNKQKCRKASTTKASATLKLSSYQMMSRSM